MKYDKSLLKDIQASSDLIPKQMYKDKEITPQSLSSINQKYFGGGMSQNHFAPAWFEYYFDMHNFEYVVEFGSQKGTLSTYFANLAGVTEKLFFETYELYPEKDWYNRTYEGCGHWFEQLAEISPYINYFHQDAFSEETKNHIMENIEQFKTFIFADGGDKIKEFKEYAPLLKPGDCIAVHDWGMEINDAAILDVAIEHKLSRDGVFATSSINLGTQIMPFIKGE